MSDIDFFLNEWMISLSQEIKIWGYSGQESRQEPGGRSKSPGGMLPTGLFSVAYSACFPVAPQTICLGDTVHNGLGLPTSVKSIIKKMLRRVA